MYYTSPMKVNYYDSDYNNQLKLSAAMKYMQQNSSEHLDAIGIGTELLLREQIVFLLSKMCIKIHRMPLCNEPVLVGTAAVSPRRAQFVREFVFDTPQGERLISALSFWLMVNPQTRKILRPATFPYDFQFQESQLTEIIDDVPMPKERGERQGSITVPVRFSHLDSNRHVNNTAYADLVCDILPFELLTTAGIDTFALAFRHEAKKGDILEISSYRQDDQQYYTCGQVDGGACFEAMAYFQNGNISS